MFWNTTSANKEKKEDTIGNNSTGPGNLIISLGIDGVGLRVALGGFLILFGKQDTPYL